MYGGNNGSDSIYFSRVEIIDILANAKAKIRVTEESKKREIVERGTLKYLQRQLRDYTRHYTDTEYMLSLLADYLVCKKSNTVKAINIALEEASAVVDEAQPVELYLQERGDIKQAFLITQSPKGDIVKYNNIEGSGVRASIATYVRYSILSLTGHSKILWLDETLSKMRADTTRRFSRCLNEMAENCLIVLVEQKSDEISSNVNTTVYELRKVGDVTEAVLVQKGEVTNEREDNFSKSNEISINV